MSVTVNTMIELNDLKRIEEVEEDTLSGDVSIADTTDLRVRLAVVNIEGHDIR